MVRILILFGIIFIVACSHSHQNISGQYRLLSEDSSIVNTMNIYEIKDDKFFFELHSNSGQYAGYIEGSAELEKDTTAVFNSVDEFDTCLIKFYLAKDIVKIKHVDGTCGLGLGADYLGNYAKIADKPQEMPLH